MTCIFLRTGTSSKSGKRGSGGGGGLLSLLPAPIRLGGRRRRGRTQRMDSDEFFGTVGSSVSTGNLVWSDIYLQENAIFISFVFATAGQGGDGTAEQSGEGDRVKVEGGISPLLPLRRQMASRREGWPKGRPNAPKTCLPRSPRNRPQNGKVPF